MSELIQKILAYLPKYFTELARCALAPKPFFAEKLKADDALTDALLFVGISYALVAIVPIPYFQQKTAWTTVAFISVQHGIALAILIPIFRLIWFLFGARGNSPAFVAIYLYQNGVLTVISMLAVFISFGYLFSTNPEVAQSMAIIARSGQSIPAELLKRDDVTMFSALQLLGLVVSFGWLCGSYGAYRQLFGMGRLRSTGVALVTLPLLVPSYFLAIWITAASRALFEATI